VSVGILTADHPSRHDAERGNDHYSLLLPDPERSSHPADASFSSKHSVKFAEYHLSVCHLLN
jgi:hypothetical protein